MRTSDPAEMTPRELVTCRIDDDSGVHVVRAAVRRVTAGIGFEREVIEEIVLVVSQLPSNILKYGRRGSNSLSRIDAEQGPPGICIVARDETAPFDLMASLRDGYDATGKLDPALIYGRHGIA